MWNTSSVITKRPSGASMKSGASIVILACVLALASCSKKEAAQSTLPVVSPDLALAALGMDKSGENGLSWGAKSGDNGSYVYKDVTLDAGDDVVTKIAVLTLSGVTMDGEEATFGRFEAQDITVGDDEFSLTADSFTLINPTPDTARGVTTMLSDYAQMDFESEDKLGFGELRIEGITGIPEDAKDGTFKVASIKLSDVTESRAGKIELNDLSLVATDVDNGGQSFEMSLKSLDMQGIDLGDGFDMEAVPEYLQNMNPYESMIDGVTLSDFSFSGFGVAGSIASILSENDIKGNILTKTQSMNDVVITLTDEAGPAQVLSGLGYDKFEFEAKSVTQLDKDKDIVKVLSSNFTMKDGFDLSMAYEVEGFKAAHDTQLALLKAAEDDADIGDQYEESVGVMLDALKIHKIGMTLDDNGLAERALDFAAGMQGTTPERIKSQMSGMMVMYSMMLQDDTKSQITRDLITAASDFIANPGTLTIGLSPKAPVAARELFNIFEGSDAGDVMTVDQLGFTATAK